MAFQPTKEFAEKLLKRSLTHVEVGAGCNANDNVAGSLQAITATSADGTVSKVVVKTFPPKESPHYQYVKENQIFRIEANVYNDLAPALLQFVQSRGGSYSLPLPEIVGSFHNDEEDWIALEDVRPAGFRMPSVFEGLTFAETRLILQELAKLHAYSYALIKHQGEQLFDADKGLLSRLDVRSQAEWQEKRLGFFGLLQASVQIAGDVLGEQKSNECQSLSKKLREFLPSATAPEVYAALIVNTDKDLFPCVIHGDIWTNNCLIKYDATGEPIEAKLVDFQQTRRGNIFEELLYFLLTSTTPELREKHLTQSLTSYYEAFVQSLRTVKVPLPKGFSLGFVVDKFCQNLKWGLVYMCFAIPLQMGNPHEAYKAAEEERKSKINNNSDNSEQKPADGADAVEDAILEIQDNLKRMYISSQPAIKRLEVLVAEMLKLA